MRRSIGWHLLLNSLAVSLVAILAIGVVSWALANAYFNQQEEEYLRERGSDLVEPLEMALRFGRQPAELQQIASFGLLTGHIRVKVVDSNGQLVADSGSFGNLIPSRPFRNSESSERAFQFFVNERGRLQILELNANGGLSALDILSDSEFPTRPGSAVPAVEPPPQPPIATISAAQVRLPLRVGSQVVAYAELSEGPAFGEVIRRSMGRALIIGGAVAVLVATLAGLLAARQITQPLEALGEAAEAMASGKLEARAPRSNLVEFDSLAQRFNIMAEKLGEMIATLEADRATLRRLIADASHELRTPLTALKTFNQLLSQEESTIEEPGASFIEESARQLDQLERLTSGLFDLSRLESRISGTDFVLADVRPAFANAVRTLRSQSESKSQRLETSWPQKPLPLRHDPSALERAASNLVANAVKFTPVGGAVDVSLRQSGQEILFVVRDTGPGIAASDLDHVFDRFFRGSTDSGEGSGLGLAIAQEIAAIHGGRIVVESELGQGSSFVMRLPIHAETRGKD